MKELECPYCHHTSSEFDPENGTYAVEGVTFKSKDDGIDVFSTRCNYCGATGPICDSAKQAGEEFSNLSNCESCSKADEIKRLRDALGIIARNVDADAVHISWCSEYAKKILADTPERKP